ncbi:hypothetical protein VaNZ11_012959 [Volvox africanus]|uniref:USP domain-containing protein n=1 Tax=Volvox africanus TaxID=51714 RepID=A0ABQ5SGE2_9CHLO|nr:hypothetical protein VaNZ11_012959 [Volvox africanus]
MVDQLQRIQTHGSRSQGARLLAALKDKNLSGRPPETGATTAYRSAGQTNSVLPFPSLVPSSPAVRPMPLRRDGAGTNRDGITVHGARDPYEMEENSDDEQNRNLRTHFGSGPGVTVGKRNGMGNGEIKKQGPLPALFSRESKRLQTARLVPAGMINLGNTCYLNAVVQVLLNMVSFTADLRNASLERLAQYLPATGVWAALRTTADKLKAARLARPSLENLKPAVEPTELRAAMGRRSLRWLSFAQQDAHEFLVELLEQLESEVLTAEAASSCRTRMPLSKTCCPTARNLSGSLVHTWTCSECGHRTRAKEPFSCLSLQMPTQGTVDLQDLFFDYLKDETIDKNCDGCSPSAPVPHTAQHHFWRLPRVLVVHIKRFMPLPQLQQALPGQETLGGDAAGAAVPVEVHAEGRKESAAQMNSAVSELRTPPREDSSVAKESAAASASIAPQPAGVPAAVGGSHESSPPAPYVYEKLHTVVKVTPGLDLACYCDATARAHVHLLEGLSFEEINPGAGANDCAAANGAQDAPLGPGTAMAGDGAATTAAAAAALAPGGTTGATLDTAGGGSTCPSPSFMQPNTSALQERTVQQQDSVPLHREHVRRCMLGGGSKAMTPGGAKLPVPDSECGTSAITTGAQANGVDGAPTPYGGCTSGIINPPGSGRRNEGLEKGRTPLGSRGGFGPLRDGSNVVGPCGALTGNPGVGVSSTPQALIRREEKVLVSGASPMDASIGCGLSSHTCNDRSMGSTLIPPDSTGRKTAGDADKGEGAAAAVAAASADRKAPRPLAANAFFGKVLGTVEACNGGGGGGSHQPSKDDLLRPPKRLCVQDTAEEEVPERRTTEPPPPVPTPLTERQLEEMTEDEQLELALQMSLAEEGGDICGWGKDSEGVGAWQSSGAGNRPPATDHVHSGRGSAAVDLTVPTAAGTAVRQSCGGPGDPSSAATGRVCASGDSAGGGGRADASGGGGHYGGTHDRWQSCGNGQSFMELQDESQGGYSMRHQDEAGQGGTDVGRMTSSGPALSGARGGKDDGAESDCSAGQTLPDSSGRGIPLIATRLDRRRARKRRQAKLFGPNVPEVAESPAVAPSRQRRRGNGSGYGDEGRLHGGLSVAYSIDVQDDGTTVLSPVSKTGKHQAMVGGSGDGSGGNGVFATAAVAADQTEAVPEDDDEDFQAAKRLSLATFAEEKGRRMRRSCGGAGTGVAAASRSAHKSRAEMKWELMMALPEPEDALGCKEVGAEGKEAEAGSGCSTPKRDRGTARVQADAHVEPPPLPPRRRSAPGGIAGGRPCDVTSRDGDGERAGGMDALVAAAGLQTSNHMHGGTPVALVAAVIDRLPQSQQQQQQQQQQRRHSSAGVPASDSAGNGGEQFKFGFIAPDAAERARVSNGSAGGLAFGVAGSRREDPVDLTCDGAGDEEEDPDLAKAIMLSLQDAQQQNNAMGDEVGGADPHPLMDLAKMDDADEGNNLLREPGKPKVVLVPDSDYEEDSNDGEGNKAGSGYTGPAEAGASRPAAKTTHGAPAKIHQSQWPGRHDGNPSDAVLSVPLAQLARYRLQGVVRHKGWTPFSGHYVADVLVPTAAGTSGQPAQIWYEHNDAVVSHVDFARVREDAAKQGYLFFFVHLPRLVTPSVAAKAPQDRATDGGAAEDAA